jgi:hypothetical protein
MPTYANRDMHSKQKVATLLPGHVWGGAGHLRREAE